MSSHLATCLFAKNVFVVFTHAKSVSFYPPISSREKHLSATFGMDMFSLLDLPLVGVFLELQTRSQNLHYRYSWVFCSGTNERS